MESAMVQRRCPLCDEDQARERFVKGRLRVVQCRACSMAYANPVDHELATGLFYDERESAYYLSPDKLESDYAPVRFERELRLFRRFCQRGAVLDVGCSTGAFLFQLQSRYPGAYRVTGTDVVEAALDHAERQGISVLRSSFLELDPPSPAYDAITFWAVLEHLMEPKRFLAQAQTLLNPGGFCFVLVPNLRSLAIRLLGARYRYIMPDHVNYFSAETLRTLSEAVSNFEVLHVTTTHFNPLVILQDWRRSPDRVPDAQRGRLLKRTTAWKQNRWLLPLQWLYKGMESVLASFNLADNLVMVLRRS